ncbi:transposase [Cytobacillus sp. Hz8]|uniref:transposase n=1 Tax=Cytobacillus sp. Hz8 TaxID=3347168 RepID=UPI0035DB6413
MRGINKQIIFEDDEDKARFLETLNKYTTICKNELYCYCLMDNHIHLLLKESGDSVSKLMKRICSSYVYWYNMKYERCGHLFQEIMDTALQFGLTTPSMIVS